MSAMRKEIIMKVPEKNTHQTSRSEGALTRQFWVKLI